MIRLCRCAGWSKSVLYAHIIRYFSFDANHLVNTGKHVLSCAYSRDLYKPAHDFVANKRV